MTDEILGVVRPTDVITYGEQDLTDEEKAQVKANIGITESGGGVFPNIITNIIIDTISSGELQIKWTDSDDSAWVGTKVVLKTGSYPVDEKDGTLIVTNTIRNQYSTTPFKQSGLTNGVQYFIGFFPYSISDSYNYDSANRASAVPVAQKEWRVFIDTTNPDPETAVSYDPLSEAATMTAGSDDWDVLFGIKPCLLAKDGTFKGYLDPNNFKNYEDGTVAIGATPASDGHVMIEFPVRGIKIEKTDTRVTLIFTDALGVEGFNYLAFTRYGTEYSKLYIGAYPYNNTSNDSTSYRNRTITYNNSGYSASSVGPSNWRPRIEAYGENFSWTTFYQYSYIQFLFILKYKTLDSRSILGPGTSSVTNLSYVYTGVCDTVGLTGIAENGVNKLFGLEYMWGQFYTLMEGNYAYWVNSYDSDQGIYIRTSTDSFSSYTNEILHWYFPTSNGIMRGYMTNIQSPDSMFLPNSTVDGSSSTFYCDEVEFGQSQTINNIMLAFGGGYYETELKKGLFRVKMGGGQLRSSYLI